MSTAKPVMENKKNLVTTFFHHEEESTGENRSREVAVAGTSSAAAAAVAITFAGGLNSSLDKTDRVNFVGQSTYKTLWAVEGHMWYHLLLVQKR